MWRRRSPSTRPVRSDMSRSTLVLTMIAAMIAGALTTARLRPVEAQQPPCADAIGQRDRAQRQLRAAQLRRKQIERRAVPARRDAIARRERTMARRREVEEQLAKERARQKKMIEEIEIMIEE